MNRNEKRWIIILIVAILMVLILVLVSKKGVNEEVQGKESTPETKEEKYTIELSDGTKINTEEEFNRKKMYGDLEISNIQYTEKDEMTVLLADVTNKGNTTYGSEIVKITIIGENGEKLSTTKPVIKKLEPGETVKINASITADVVNAKDFIIEPLE